MQPYIIEIIMNILSIPLSVTFYPKNDRTKIGYINTICSIKCVNQQGKYWCHYYYLDGDVYVFDSSMEYFNKQTQFKKTKIKDYILRWDRIK